MGVKQFKPSTYSERDIQKKYGISRRKYLELLKNQGYCCAICDNSNEDEPLFVDHDHITGKVRGLLCRHCNTMLGFARDNIIRLKNGAEYLKRAK